jgi:hypothetical protein
MSDQYGALTDHWGLIGTGGALENKAVLVASSSTPVAKSVNRAQDANGDNAAEALAGQTAAGTLAEASCTYALSQNTVNLNTLKLGEIAANKIAATLSAVTSNSAWPQITVTGLINTITVVAPTGKLNTFSIADSITLTNAKRAQLLDFTVDADCRLTGSTYAASIETAEQTNGLGVIVAHGISGGVVTQSCELVAVADVAAWTPGVTWKETQAPGADEGAAAWHTTSASAEKLLARDNTTP